MANGAVPLLAAVAAAGGIIAICLHRIEEGEERVGGDGSEEYIHNNLNSVSLQVTLESITG